MQMMDQLVTWPATPVTSSVRIRTSSESITRLTLSSNVRIVTNSLARDPTHDTFRNAKTVLAKSSPVPSVTTKLIGPNVSVSTRGESMRWVAYLVISAGKCLTARNACSITRRHMQGVISPVQNAARLSCISSQGIVITEATIVLSRLILGSSCWTPAR